MPRIEIDQVDTSADWPMTWWLTGLSGAGKTSLALALAQSLRAKSIPVCVLDGDELREGLSRDLGFSPEDREEQCRRVAEIARTLNRNGIHAIVALISPTRRSRQAALQTIGAQMMREVFVSTPLEVCQQRDVKGLYKRAQQEKNLSLTGVRSPYEIPLNPDCTIDTSQVDVETAVQLLLALLQRK